MNDQMFCLRHVSHTTHDINLERIVQSNDENVTLTARAGTQVKMTKQLLASFLYTFYCACTPLSAE